MLLVEATLKYFLPPFASCCSSFEVAAACVALPRLDVSFGREADYPVVMATANRKCPEAGNASGLFRCVGAENSPRCDFCLSIRSHDAWLFLASSEGAVA